MVRLYHSAARCMLWVMDPLRTRPLPLLRLQRMSMDRHRLEQEKVQRPMLTLLPT